METILPNTRRIRYRCKSRMDGMEQRAYQPTRRTWATQTEYVISIFTMGYTQVNGEWYWESDLSPGILHPIRNHEAFQDWLNGSGQSLDSLGDVWERAGMDTHMDESGGRKRTASDADLPDLGSLIDNSAGSSASQQGRQGQPGRPRGPVMEDAPMDGGGETALARAGGGGPSSVTKETPISSYPSLSYGLPETHTTILPWTTWLSAVVLDKDTPVQVKLRMNSIWDMLDASFVANPAAGGAWTNKGLGTTIIDARGLRANSGANFPAAFTAGQTEATERPAWRDYWASFYDFYTVLGCEYEIIITNPAQHWTSQTITGSDAGKMPIVTGVTTGAATQNLSTNAYTPSVQVPCKLSANAVCAVQFDTYSDTATSTGNVMPLTQYEEIRTYKNIRWYRINDNNGTEIIRGQYKPGQAKRNIINDGDVKTWTATGTTLPNLKEILTLNFFQDPMNTTTLTTGVNMEINLKYIVQFKDLKQQARYPNTITSNQDINIVLNEDPAAAGSALQRWL